MVDSNGEGAAEDAADEAFARVGHETRVRILTALAGIERAERPVRFSRLREAVGDIGSAHFNYHLNELVGHYLERTDEGYGFTQPGKRAAQAILSGSMTGNDVSGLQSVEQPCHHCGGSLEVMVHQERIAIYCTDCSGTYESSNYQDEHDDVPDEYGFLGLHDLPPTGMADRSPTEAVEAAHRWSLTDTLSTVAGLCPRCGGGFDTWVDVCEDHDGGGETCESCGYRHAVVHSASCRECTYDTRLPFGTFLVGTTPAQAFLTAHDRNVLDLDYVAFSRVFKNFEERVRESDPLEAEFTFEIDGDRRMLTVDESMTVTDVRRN